MFLDTFMENASESNVDLADAVLAKINDKDYIESMMRKRMQV